MKCHYHNSCPVSHPAPPAVPPHQAVHGPLVREEHRRVHRQRADEDDSESTGIIVEQLINFTALQVVSAPVEIAISALLDYVLGDTCHALLPQTNL